MLIIEPGNLDDPQVIALLQDSHVLMQALFPPEENYALDLADLAAPGVHFFAAREGDTVLGTGALVCKPGYGEVKSMFCAEAARGKGVASAILRQIEDQARSLGLTELKLETGEPLAAAVRLYLRHGFETCARFGAYAPNETSIYMRKHL